MKKTVKGWITVDSDGVHVGRVCEAKVDAEQGKRRLEDLGVVMGEIRIVPATLTYEVPAKAVLPRCRDVDGWAQRKLAKAKKRKAKR